VERSDLAANLARKNYYPDYTVRAATSTRAACPRCGSSAWIEAAGVARKAARGGRRAGLHGEPGAARLRSRGRWIQASIREEYTLAATSRKLIDLYEKSVDPEARLALESSIASYQTGTLDSFRCSRIS